MRESQVWTVMTFKPMQQHPCIATAKPEGMQSVVTDVFVGKNKCQVWQTCTDTPERCQ